MMASGSVQKRFYDDLTELQPNVLHLQHISLRVRRILRSADGRTKFAGNQIAAARNVGSYLSSLGRFRRAFQLP
jgi:hypothetical protein